MLSRRQICSSAAAILLALSLPVAVSAHHGWRWTAEGNFKLTGTIESVKLGNPHGILRVDAEGEMWTVEIGQPWRHDRIGLDDEALAVGTAITAIGHRSANPDEKVLKAERMIIAGKLYNLYPDRS